jgi:hypothetical protein
VCFICKKEDHVVEACPIKSQGHSCAKYIGSAASGLDFYFIETPEEAGTPIIDFTNCGKVYIETGANKRRITARIGHLFQPILAMANQATGRVVFPSKISSQQKSRRHGRLQFLSSGKGWCVTQCESLAR